MSSRGADQVQTGSSQQPQHGLRISPISPKDTGETHALPIRITLCDAGILPKRAPLRAAARWWRRPCSACSASGRRTPVAGPPPPPPAARRQLAATVSREWRRSHASRQWRPACRRRRCSTWRRRHCSRCRCRLCSARALCCSSARCGRRSIKEKKFENKTKRRTTAQTTCRHPGHASGHDGARPGAMLQANGSQTGHTDEQAALHMSQISFGSPEERVRGVTEGRQDTPGSP